MRKFSALLVLAGLFFCAVPSADAVWHGKGRRAERGGGIVKKIITLPIRLVQKIRNR